MNKSIAEMSTPAFNRMMLVLFTIFSFFCFYARIDDGNYL